MRVDKINLEITNKQTNKQMLECIICKIKILSRQKVLNIKKILEQVNGLKRSKHCKIHIKEDIYAIN